MAVGEEVEGEGAERDTAVPLGMQPAHQPLAAPAVHARPLPSLDLGLHELRVQVGESAVSRTIVIVSEGFLQRTILENQIVVVSPFSSRCNYSPVRYIGQLQSRSTACAPATPLSSLSDNCLHSCARLCFVSRGWSSPARLELLLHDNVSPERPM